MADRIAKNFVVNLTTVGVSTFIRDFTDANQALELLGKGVGAASGTIEAFEKIIDRGQSAEKLSRAFNNLTATSQELASGGLEKLQSALSNTVSKLDLLQISNQALNAGLKPDQLLQVAKSAEHLGDVVGRSATEAFRDLAQALALGQERQLKYYLGAVDTTKAEEALAKQYGVSAKQLTQYGKTLALQNSALELLRKKTLESGEGARTAGDALDRLRAVASDAVTDFSQAANRNRDLADAIDVLGTVVKNFDATPFVRFVELMLRLAGPAANGVNYVVEGWTHLFEDLGVMAKPLAAQISDINVEIDKLSQQRNSASSAKITDILELFENAQAGGRDTRVAQLTKQINELKAARDGLVDQQALAKLKQLERDLDGLLNGPLFRGDGGKKPPKGDLFGGVDELRKKIEELGKTLDREFSEAKLSSLRDALSRAVDAGDSTTFTALRDQIQQNIEDGVRTAYAALGDDPRVEAYAKLVGSTFAENANEQMQEKLKEAFQSSVDFFADIFENAITGTTFSLEDALKRVAVGFASTLAAGIAQSLGINVSGIGSAQGLGGLIGGTVLDALGFDIKSVGQSALGSVLGSVFGGGSSIAAGTTGIGPIASGAGYAGALAGIGGGSLAAGTIGIGPVASGATYGGALGALGTAATAAGPPGWAIAAAAAAASLILPKAIDFVSDLFGGTKDPDTLARRGLRDELKQYFGEDLMVNTVRGRQDLTQVDYAKLPQFLASSPIGDESVGLASTFAQVLGGGGKLGEDATAIFAQIIGQAGNFNEALINTWGIMDKLGMSSDQLKDSQKELFLDGKIELSEYGQALANLNLLAQNNLAGTGSVADAWNVVISATADNRTKLKALELAYVEFAELGISSFQDMAAYLMDRFGPDAAQVFIALGQAGIDSAEDIKNANADAILAIFNALAGLDTQVQATFRNVGTTIADAVTTGAQQAQEAVEQSAKVIINKAGEISTAFRDIKNNANDLARYDASQQYFSNSSGSGGKQPQIKQGSFPNNPFRP